MVVPWPGEQGVWHFAHVGKKQSEDIRATYGKSRRGFGAIRVAVTLGKTKWETSIFPDSRSGTYVLPLKAAVRRAEAIAADDTITFTLNIKPLY